MNEQLNRKQRIHYFFLHLIAFASIFLLLGLIVFQLLQSSIYQQVDRDLLRLAGDQQFIQRQISGNQRSNQNHPDKKLDNPPPNNFQQQVILWSKDGTIVNQAVLGSRLIAFALLQLEE